MNKRIALSAAMLLAVSAVQADAQLRLGVAAGPSYPMGRLADVVDRGFHGGIALDVGVPLLPLALRGDVMVQNLPGTAGSDAYRQVFGTFNGRVSLPIPAVQVYATGGVGYYGSSFRLQAGESNGFSRETGFNGGIGVSIDMPLRLFLEARYHRVLTSPAHGFVPVTIGLHF